MRRDEEDAGGGGREEAKTRGEEEARRGGEEQRTRRREEVVLHHLFASPPLRALRLLASSLHRFIASSPLRLIGLVWLLAIPVLSPLFQPTLTRSADGLLHLYRMVALDHLIRQGVLFSRWLPDLAYGYGLPLFIFYAPLSYYITEAFHLLGLSAIGAFNASAALALLMSAAGVYLFVKDLFGPRAGILAGVAYIYAPYPLFNTFSRGSLPVTWAGALFPFVFWAFGRLIRENKVGYIPLSAFLCGAALLMHNISNLLFMPLLIFYVTIELLLRRERPSDAVYLNGGPHLKFGPTLRVGLALALGLGLAAFFWLPATLEKEFAQVERVITPPDFDYRSNFVSLSQLFSLPPPANTGLLNPTDPLTLGPAQVTLAAIGLLALLLPAARRRISGDLLGTQEDSPPLPRSPAPLLFATLALLATIFMILPLSVGVWDALPLFAFVQQPHRLLSVAAFLLAILAGAAVAGWSNRLSFGLTLAGIMLIFITAVPLLYPQYYAALPAAPTLTGMMAYERASGAIGTTSFGEYLPKWVQQTPQESPLLAQYQSGATIERLDQAYLPAGASVESVTYDFNQVDLTINAPHAFQAVFHTFYFPGWQAWVDDQPAPLAPVTERGLIGVTVPAGRHRLHLSFTETPIRLLANTLSLLSLIALTIYFSIFQPPSPIPHAKRSSLILQPLSFSLLQFAITAALALALILTKTVYLDRSDNPLKRLFTGVAVAGVDVSRRVNFGRQVNLLGYNLNQPSLASGQSFKLTLYWQARQPLATHYSALAQLVDGQQHLYASQDNLHPGNLPTSRWEPWGFVQDSHTIRVTPGTPPGDYFLVAGLYDPATWARLPVLEGGDPGWSDVIAIPVRVTRPTDLPTLDAVEIKWLASLEDLKNPGVWPIRLLGATPEQEKIPRNDFLRVALFWTAVDAPTGDYQVSLRLLAPDGTPALSETSRPSYGRYPTLQWTAGELVRDNHAFWIPADFPAGLYRLQVQLLDDAGQPVTDWLELGQLPAE